MCRWTLAATSQTGMVTAQELHARGARNTAAILVRRVTELYIGTTLKAEHRSPASRRLEWRVPYR
ncbi:hypothetical protein E2C01_093546 [Portunus trituberculatus]|uniref:Uncharacterized protein n=1 Tax=Portunus trituberculatus TaxID=210409 RepID=A0A5B7JN04_PORTR|nr:hypothetical protein [Portunus trituberculatus]